jgi:hypothetical protein
MRVLQQGDLFPPRFLLEGVPQVRFYDGKQSCPEDVPFPSCVKAFLDYMGDSRACCKESACRKKAEVDCSYAYVMGTSGAAFRLSWGEGWQLDNVALHYMSPDPEAPYQRAFDSLGYPFDWVVKTGAKTDEQVFREKIMVALAKQRTPVFAFGVIGPPEPCLITGYDEEGAVLIGWNFFQGFSEFAAGVEFGPGGQFRKRGWFDETDCLAIIGEKKDPPAMKQVLRDSLSWALRVMRDPMPWPERHNGLAAYYAWAAALQWEGDSSEKDMEVIRERFMVHDDAVGTVAEGRWYGAVYLHKMMEHVPEVLVPLAAAIKCLEREHDLMWEIWNLTGGLGRRDENVRAFARPEVRVQMIRLIGEARANDAEVSRYFENALELIAV